MSARSHASITPTSGVITFGWVPARGGAAGGAEGASSARYLRTVRQSTPHSRAISAYDAPAACRARKRRTFIQDSESRIMSRSPFGFVDLAVDEPKGDPALRVRKGSTRRDRPTRQVVRGATHEVVRGHQSEMT